MTLIKDKITLNDQYNNISSELRENLVSQTSENFSR